MSSVVRNMREGVIIIRDGTGTPITLTLDVSEGDLSFTEQRNAVVIMNRGTIHSRKQGDQAAMPVSFSVKFAQWSYDTGATTGVSVRDALTGEGGASAWVSTDAAACGPYAVDLIFRVTDPCNPTHYEQLVFPKFHADSIAFREGNDANTLSVSGTSLASKPTRTYV